jgi:hypothetical protein
MGSAKNQVVAIVMLLVVVGGITYLVQNMRSWRTYTPTPHTKGGGGKLEVLRFNRQQEGLLPAIFELGLTRDKQMASVYATRVAGVLASPSGHGPLLAAAVPMPVAPTGYALEVERDSQGSYYFPFTNRLGAAAEMGVADFACAECTSADVCLLPESEWQTAEEILGATPWSHPALNPEPAWHALSRSDRTGFKVPSDGRGILRLNWKARGGFGTPVRCGLRLWMEPQNDLSSRQFLTVAAPVVVSRPILFEPDRRSVGILGPGQIAQVEFYCWSPMHDQPKVSFQPRKPDPLFQVEVRPLSAPECGELQETLSQKTKDQQRFRVRTGYHVKVTIREEHGKLQMPQGPFQRHLPIFVDGDDVEYARPAIVGIVKGEVDVGGEADQGRIQLKTFSTSEPKTAVIPVYASPQVKLEKCEHFPPFLEVELERNQRESTSQRAQWDLKVTVPAGKWTGEMPADSRVVLRIAGDAPRLIHIPVMGIATR